MHMKRTGLLLKVAALLAAMLMLTAAMAFAQAEAPADWDGMIFSLTWFDGNGEQQTAQAVPVYEQPGSFWICIPGDANAAGLFFDASHPWHEYTFDPMPGSALPVPADAGDRLNADTPYIVVTAADSESYYSFRLYISFKIGRAHV